MMDDAPINFASSPFMNCPGKKKFLQLLLPLKHRVGHPAFSRQGKTWKSKELVPEQVLTGKLGGNGKQRGGHCKAGKARKSLHRHLRSKNSYL